MDSVAERLCVACDKVVSRQQLLACCSSHYAVSTQSNSVLVHTTGNPEPPLHLTGHHSNVSALVFGDKKAPLLLCSAAEDYVIVWDIERCYRQVKEGVIASGLVVGTLLGKVAHLAFCPLNERVAVCSGCRVTVLNAKKEDVVAVLRGHLGPVTASGFCPWAQNHLASISEDRTFKVWDVKKEEVLYQSSVLSGYPLLSFHFLDEGTQLVTGSADGMIWSYSLPEDHRCCLVTKLDLPKLLKNHKERVESTDGPSNANSCHTQQVEVDTAKPILTIWSQKPNLGSSYIKSESQLWIGSLDGLYLLDLASSELLAVLPFKDKASLSIPVVGSWATSQGRDNTMYCLVSAMFEAKLAFLDVNVAVLQKQLLESEFPEEGSPSVFPRAPLMATSPLKDELKKQEAKTLATTRSKTGVKDHPLVFHSRVKSSGYTASPRTMFTPKTNGKNSNGAKETTPKLKAVLSGYPSHREAPTVPHATLAVSSAHTPVRCVQYSGDAERILCGLGDGSVFMYKPSLRGNPAVYPARAHGKPVNSLSWSHSRRHFLSSSEDHTSVWPAEVTEPLLTLKRDSQSKAMTWAQFYYLDKFVLMASGSNLLLYLYRLDRTKDDVKRYQQKSTSRLSSRISMHSGTDVTALSAINDFFSYIVLAAGADRSIQVFDMNRGCTVSKIPNAHCRAVHHLCQNKGSIFSTQDRDSNNLFLSSAVTDGIKLWDLRTTRCVRRYECHPNRRCWCNVAVSPCGNYIATGSEDSCVYLYDIRSSRFLHKLQRQSDIVLSVAFNPAEPELLSGTVDGQLILFRPEESRRSVTAIQTS